jgi:hypothetical protein
MGDLQGKAKAAGKGGSKAGRAGGQGAKGGSAAKKAAAAAPRRSPLKGLIGKPAPAGRPNNKRKAEAVAEEDKENCQPNGEAAAAAGAAAAALPAAKRAATKAAAKKRSPPPAAAAEAAAEEPMAPLEAQQPSRPAAGAQVCRGLPRLAAWAL